MTALVAISPEPTQRGCSTTWVAPWAFAEHFPDIARDRCDEVLGEIRGVLLDGTQIGELAGRIEELLTVQPSAIRVPPLNKRVGPN